LPARPMAQTVGMRTRPGLSPRPRQRFRDVPAAMDFSTGPHPGPTERRTTGPTFSVAGALLDAGASRCRSSKAVGGRPDRGQPTSRLAGARLDGGGGPPELCAGRPAPRHDPGPVRHRARQFVSCTTRSGPNRNRSCRTRGCWPRGERPPWKPPGGPEALRGLEPLTAGPSARKLTTPASLRPSSRSAVFGA